MTQSNWGGSPSTRGSTTGNSASVTSSPLIHLDDPTRARAAVHDFLISPAERPPITDLGPTSAVPEAHGADVYWISNRSLRVGLQRKAISDLVASAHDGRLNLEVAQLQSCNVRVLIVEGQASWSADGVYLSAMGTQRSWTRRRQRMMLLSLQQAGIHVLHADTALDTAHLIIDVADHLASESDSGLSTRPSSPTPNRWGTVDDVSWVAWAIQSVPGIGPKVARAIAEAFGPIWKPTVTVAQLASVPGVGPKRAEAIIAAFGGSANA